MFRITKRGSAETIAIVDTLRYIYRDKTTGTFYQAPNADFADGIAVKGSPYNFGADEKLEGYPFVDISEVDGSRLVENLQNENKALQTELTETQQALTESYESNSDLQDELTQTQLALTELYEKFS